MLSRYDITHPMTGPDAGQGGCAQKWAKRLRGMD